MDPQISAVIPTYNRASLIDRAVQSVLQQTYAPVEILVVDDGSTDDTKSRVEALGSQVTYIHQENAGAAAARNAAVRRATGDWIAFLDSDDIWLDVHLERMAEAIRGTSGAALFYFGDTDMAPAVGRSGSLWKRVGIQLDKPYELRENGTDWAMLSNQPMMIQSSVFRRKTLLQRKLLWEELKTRDDTHLFFSLSLGDPICAVAGCGSIMTDDDTPIRLTHLHNSHTRTYWTDTVLMYGDILRRSPNAPRKVRNRLRGRKADGHWHLAGIALRRGELFGAFREMLTVAATEPSFLGRRSFSGLARRISGGSNQGQ